MAWRRPGDKPLSEPMMVSLPTHICVTRPQWVNSCQIRMQCNWYKVYFYKSKNAPNGEHDDVIKWKHIPRYWLFVRGIHRSPVNSPNKGQWRGALIFSLVSTETIGWVSNRDAGDLRRHRAHYEVIVMRLLNGAPSNGNVPLTAYPIEYLDFFFNLPIDKMTYYFSEINKFRRERPTFIQGWLNPSTTSILNLINHCCRFESNPFHFISKFVFWCTVIANVSSFRLEWLKGCNLDKVTFEISKYRCSENTQNIYIGFLEA